MENKKPVGRPKKDYEKLSIKMPPELCELTRETAKRLGMTQAELWADALKAYIKERG